MSSPGAGATSGTTAPQEPAARLGPAAPRWRDPLLLTALVVLVTGLDVLWRSIDERPPDWDQARHLGDSVLYLHLFSLAHPLRFLEYYLYYPPGVPWVTDVVYAIAGSDSIQIAILGNGVFLAVLVFSTYGIGRHLWNPRVGLLATFYVVTTPMLVSGFKQYWLDAPLTAVVALAMYLLLRTEEFARRRFCVLLGLVCGFGMLVKWSFVFAVALPLLYAIVRALRLARRERRFARPLNLLLAGLLTLALCGLWYLHNLSALRADLHLYNTRASHVEGDPSLPTLSSVLWYAWNLLDNQLYLVPLLFLAAGLVAAARDRRLAARNLYPLLWVAGVYVCFTLIRNKDARYTLPLLPGVAILATSWIDQLGRRWARRLLGGAVVVYGAATFAAISFGTALLPKEVAIHIPAYSFFSATVGGDPARAPCSPRCLVLFAQHGYVIGPPVRQRWYQQQVFELISRVPAPERTFSFQGGDSIWFNTWGTRYYAALYGATWVNPYDGTFVILRGAGPVPPPPFQELAYFRLPDADSLILYGR